MGLEFGVLGPVRAGEDGVPLAVPAGKQRLLLAVLLARANRPVPAGTIVQTLWPGEATPGSRASLHNHVMRLRRTLGATASARVRTSGDAYLFEAAESELDHIRFTALLERAEPVSARGDRTAARDLLREALSLWRGRPFEDLALEGWLADEAARLEELRWLATESWVDAEQRLGGHTRVVADLRALTQTHPLRERFHAQLMLSLHATGQTAAALEVYQRARTALVEELGIEPGEALRAAHRSVLSGRDTDWDSDGDTGRDTGRDTDGAADREVPEPRARAVPRTLPAGIGDFTGRQQQVTRLVGLVPDEQALRQTDAVVISSIGGMGGIGKTTLAVHVGHLVRERFPDGQLFADLRGTARDRLDPHDVLGAFLRHLGYGAEALPADTDERAALYRSALANRRTLVLLDNARDEAQVKPLIPGGAGNLVLLTVRRRLVGVDGAVHLDLDLLDEADAHELFARIVGADRVAAEPEAVREVLAVCAGLPLAVRLAGVRLASRPNWRVSDLAERLRSAERRLDGFELGDRGLRAAFETGYAALAAGEHGDGSSGGSGGDRGDSGGDSGPPPAARAFCLLGLWTGADLDLPAAAALLGLPTGATERLLELLVDLNLVQSARPGRYGLHDLLRVYAAELAARELSAAESRAALNRLLTWYAKAADAASAMLAPDRIRQPIEAADRLPPFFTPADPAEAAAWCRQEQANLVSAVHLARDRDLTTLARQLPMALWTFLQQQRDMKTWISVLDIALDVTLAEGDPLQEASVRNNLAIALIEDGRPAAALEHLETSARIRREHGDFALAHRTLANLGIAAMEAGEPERALASLLESLDLCEQTGNRDGAAVAHTNIGELLLRLGRPREAVPQSLLARGLYLERDADDPRLAEVLITLSESHLLLGEVADARTDIEEAVRVTVVACRPHVQARALRQYGHVLLAGADPDGARAAWSEAAHIFTELDPPAAQETRVLIDELTGRAAD